MSKQNLDRQAGSALLDALARIAVACALAILVGRVGAIAATTLYATDTASSVGTIATTGPGKYCTRQISMAWAPKLLNTANGASTKSYAIVPEVTPSPTPGFGCTHSADGTVWAVWLSPPLSAGATISSTDTLKATMNCIESQAAANTRMEFTVYRWSPTRGFQERIGSVLGSEECRVGTPVASTPGPTAIPTAVTLNADDRIALFITTVPGGGTWGGNGSRTQTLYYNNTGAGQASITFANATLSFAADTNTGNRGETR